jgi:hypothetical protein
MKVLATSEGEKRARAYGCFGTRPGLARSSLLRQLGPVDDPVMEASEPFDHVLVDQEALLDGSDIRTSLPVTQCFETRERP